MARRRLVLMHPNQKWSKLDLTTTWNIPATVLCRLAAMVKDVVDVTILDCQLYDMSPEECRRRLVEARPDYVGISMLTSEYAATMDSAVDLVKAIDPAIVTIVGGVHVTTDSQAAMANPHVDYGCRGEGDHLLRQLMLYLQGDGPLPTIGLLYRRDGRIVVQERALVDDLDGLPPPAYELVNMADYINQHSRYGPNRLPVLPGMALTISRGCPFGCSFCQVETISGRKIRVPGPMTACDEFERLKTEYGIRSLVFFDDNLFASGRRIKAILAEMIRRRLDLKWSVAGFPIFAMDDELLDLMAAAGCVGVNVAIESGTERVLKEVIGKPIKDLAHVPGMIDGIKRRGMWVLANFIIGLPTETWREIRQTIDFAEHCGADYCKFFVAVPLKGTRMYDQAVATGSFDVPVAEAVVNWRFSQLKGADWTPQDVTILRAYEWDRINFAPDRIDKVAEIWGMPKDEMAVIRRQTLRAALDVATRDHG